MGRIAIRSDLLTLDPLRQHWVRSFNLGGIKVAVTLFTNALVWSFWHWYVQSYCWLTSPKAVVIQAIA
jgi:hypothetical protein